MFPKNETAQLLPDVYRWLLNACVYQRVLNFHGISIVL